MAVGRNCYIGDGVYMDLADTIQIRNDVVVSGGASFVTHADCNRSPLSEHYPREQGPIQVEDGAWIGFGATITHSVTIGKSAVVGAGAVVRNDVEPHTVVGGVPAEIIDKVYD
jgi:acetyltransferase-like isoleucine patch superfamily enzyme